MKTLKHQGIYIPPKPKQIVSSIHAGKKVVQLDSETANMAVQWAKKLETPYVTDPVFRKNFFTDFCIRLRIEHNEVFDWSKIKGLLAKQKVIRSKLTKEEKKKAVMARKKVREALRSQYGVATVNSTMVEINNWTAEPSCIFMGRGEHPKRGSWKPGPTYENIILNLSPDSPRPQGNWKEIVWEPNKLWIAKWEDKLSGKTKYVWFSDSFGKKQERERAKFDKARELGKNLGELESHINHGLYFVDPMKRKVAGVCYLIFYLNMRVGDEKEPGEADTVGAITLRPEHIKILGNNVSLDFLGKDSVRWTKSLETDMQFINILQENSGVGSYTIPKCLNNKFSKIEGEEESLCLTKILRNIKNNVDFITKEELKQIQRNLRRNVYFLRNGEREIENTLEKKLENIIEKTEKNVEKLLTNLMQKGIKKLDLKQFLKDGKLLNKEAVNVLNVEKLISEFSTFIILIEIKKQGKIGNPKIKICKSCALNAIESFISPNFVKSWGKNTLAIFSGVTSKDVTKFLREVMPKISAKTFRIYRATEAVKTHLKAVEDDMSKEPEFIHKYEFKLAILSAAKICNHKKALPKGYVEKLQKKEDKINATRAKIREMNRKDKDSTKQCIRLSKNIIASNLYRQTSEWNLNTSLKSYIDPRIFTDWGQKNNFDVSEFYSSALRKKYSWCLI